MVILTFGIPKSEETLPNEVAPGAKQSVYIQKESARMGIYFRVETVLLQGI